MKNLIINNNDSFCHWNHNYPCKSGANILAFQNQAQDRSAHQVVVLLQDLATYTACKQGAGDTLKEFEMPNEMKKAHGDIGQK